MIRSSDEGGWYNTDWVVVVVWANVECGGGQHQRLAWTHFATAMWPLEVEWSWYGYILLHNAQHKLSYHCTIHQSLLHTNA